MTNRPIASPVVMIIFNRPDTTDRVFAEVARARPRTLLVIGDGPRETHPGEAELCATTRRVIDQVNWPCNVLTNYADRNMGCRQRVASGLSWVFETVEEAIILEDDCVPEPSFFRFCDELLAHYRTDESVMMISGDNFQQGKLRGQASYYFSRYCHVWGWASWRRAWRHYDVEMSDWPEVRNSALLGEVLDDRGQVRRWSKNFDIIHSGVVDTWDVQWMYACWRQRALTIIPNTNLVTNIGFGVAATHTKNETDRFAALPVQPMKFPLQHPSTILRHAEADQFTERTMFHPSWTARMQRAIQKAATRLRM